MSWVEDANRQVDFLIKQLHLKGTEKILDLACGFGRHSLEFARRGYDVTGIDITPAYIDYANEQAKKENLNANPSNPNWDKNVTDKKVSNNTNNVKPVVKNVAAKNNKNVPKTGDNANVLLWIALAVISCGVLAGAGVAVRKRK